MGYLTISDKRYNGSLHEYEIIGETDPYYSNVEECDMLSNFLQDIAGPTTIDEGMTALASNYPVQPTKLLDMNEIYIHLPPANRVAGIIHRSFENQTSLKPAYRKTPVPLRKLMSISGSVEIEVDTELTYEHMPPLCTSQPTNNKHRDNATNTHAETNSLILATESNTISAFEDAPTLVGTKEASLSPPVYCNMDMEDAESVHEVYTI